LIGIAVASERRNTQHGEFHHLVTMMEEAATAADGALSPALLSLPKFPRRLKQLSVENRNVAVRDYVNALAALPKCMNATSRGQAVATGCDCLHKHVQNNPRLAGRVALAVANFTVKPRAERIQTLITWIQYADILASVMAHRRRQFLLIETKIEEDNLEEADEEDDEPCFANQAKLVCQSSLMRLLGIGPDAWKTVNLASATNTVPVHGLTGRSSNYAMGDATTTSLQAFFEGLKDHACPRATRFVRTESGFELRDDDVEVMELPTSWTKRAVFARWLDECGWRIKTDSIGRTTMSEKEGVAVAARVAYCSWPFFVSFWKTNYGYLIVPKSREDICGDCFIFMNAHKYKQSKDEESLTSDEEDDDDDLEEREARIAKAYRHVENAQKQRDLFNLKVEEARSDAALLVPHRLRRYCLVADYCQNMALPHFGGEQPGETYYFSPLSVYCFGMVDPTVDKLFAHLYTEGQGQKGGNNVASLIMKTLKHMKILKEEEAGRELSIVMDNCGGQNKNRMVLRLALYLVEVGYFQDVNLIFLVRGHTKNPCDRMFNTLKKDYHRSNCYTFHMLADMLRSENVEVLPVEEGDWENWDAYLDRFYMRFQSGTVQRNHIFSVSAQETGETVMSLREADGAESTVRKFKRGKATLEERRPALKETTRDNIPFPGVKEIKQVELFTKWREYVPIDYKDEMCPEVAIGVIKQQRREKKERLAKRQRRVAANTIEGENKNKQDSEIEMLVKDPEVLDEQEETTTKQQSADDGMSVNNNDAILGNGYAIL
jgi:hypothetical protein